jgi:hypothetical protein
MVRNVNHAATGSAQIVDNMKAVANAAKNTTHGAEETNEAAQKLSKMAMELRELVSQFKYGSNGTDGQAPYSGGKSGRSLMSGQAGAKERELESMAGSFR